MTTIQDSYPEVMKKRVVAVTEFKAKCLSLLDDVGERGTTITITKRGRSLAIVRPARNTAWKSPEGALAGKVILTCDLAKVDTSELWNAVHREPGHKD